MVMFISSQIIKKNYKEKSKLTYQFHTLLSTKLLGIIAFVPSSKWSGINQNNTILDQGLGSNQFVIGSIVHNIDDTRLSGTVC